MIRDLGIVPPGTTLYIPFHTFDSNDPSASVTITGLATSDIEIYKDGGTTQRASDSGYSLLDTDGTDFDGITGIHGLSINLADNTTAGFYAAGSQYWVVISSVTVDAATVNFVLCTFQIGYPSALLNTTIATLSSQTSFTLTSGPAEDDALNGQWVLIHDVASAVQVGSAIVSDYTGSTKTVTLAAGTTFTAAATDNISFMGPSPLQPATAGRTAAIGTSGQIDANVTQFGGSNGTFSGGRPEINTTHIAGAAVNTASAQLGVNVVTNNDKSGYSLTATTGLGNQTANITGNLSGSVGSVTGAVGSVTGAVGSVTAAVTVGTNNDKTGYALTAGERNSIADALLDRDMSTGTDSGSATVRTVRQALRFLRNKWSIAAGTLTVTKEDDTTTSWTGTVTTAASDPVSAVDPASS